MYREKYMSLYGEALEFAKNLLTHSPSLQDLANFQHVARHGSASVVAVPTAANVAKNLSTDKSNPKVRSRANTVAFKQSAADDMATTSKSAKHRGVLKGGKGSSKVGRSQTFLDKEEKKERPHTAHHVCPHQSHHRSSSSTSGGGATMDDLPDGGNFINPLKFNTDDYCCM